MIENKDIELILQYGVGRSGLSNENEVIASALRELLSYRNVGTVEGYEIAINSYTDAYNRMKEYKSKISRKIRPTFLRNLSDTTSLWSCECGYGFKTHHEPGILEGTNVLFCSNCGVAYDWVSEEE